MGKELQLKRCILVVAHPLNKPRALIAFSALKGRSIGGGQHEALAAAEALKDAGFRVALLCGGEPDFDELSRELGVKNSVDELFLFNPGSFFPYSGFLKRVIHLLYAPNIRPDLWVNYNADGDPFLIPLNALIDDEVGLVYYFISAHITRLWRTRISGYGFFKKSYRAAVSKLIHHIIKRIKRHGVFIAISKYTAKIVEDACRIRPKVLYGSIDGSVYRWRGESKSDFMAASGRLVPYKRFDLAIRAAKLLGRRLIILGAVRDEGYYEALSKVINRMGLGDEVKILADLSLEERAEILKKAKVFVQCSVEGFGKAVAEAMAAGCIPVVSKTGGQSEYTPREFQYSSFDEMLQKIEEAFDAPSAISREVSERAMEFDMPRFKARFIGLLKEENLIR